jgi:hypothetical protein
MTRTLLKICTRLPLYALFLAATAAFADEPPVKGKGEPLPIVLKAIAFHGGDLYRASETELDVCSRSGCFHVRARLDGDAFEYEVEGAVRGGRRRVSWSSERLERFDDGQSVAVAPGDEQGLQDWVMARVYFPFLPYRLNDPSVFKEDLGLETWDDRQLHKVKVTFAPGSSTDASDEYLYYFDPATGRVEQFAYSFEGRPGGLRFRRATNHRRVGGILFFDQQNLGVAGDDLRVDQITPAFVAERMQEVSVVRFDGVEVRPLH